MNVTSRFLPWLAKIIPLFLLLLAAAQLASLTWKVLPLPEITAATEAAGFGETQTQAREQTTTLDISRYHLFGQYVPPRQAPPPVVKRPVAPPKPPLTLNIFGIIASDNPKRARVILSLGERGTQEVYAVGDSIPKDYQNKGLAKEAVVKKIAADSITIDQQGVERVYYYQQGKTSAGQTVNAAQTATPPTFTSRAAPLPPARQQQLLGEVKNRLQNNPASLRQFVRLSVYNEGNRMAGFKIYPRPGQEDYFRAMGLEKADIVTSINGQSLQSTREAMQALNELTKATTVQLMVRRNGLDLPVSVQLPQ